MNNTNGTDSNRQLQRGARHTVTNLASLAAIQVANAASPLIIYPFILAVIGNEGYVDIVLAEVFALYLLSFVLYSFEIDGVSSIVGLNLTDHRDDISRVYSEILALRMVFYALGLCVIEAVLFFVHPALGILVLGWSFVSLSYALQSNWLFQALEHNLPLAITTIVSRLGALLTVLIMIREPGQYQIVPFVIGGWYLAGAIVAMTYVVVKLRLKWVRPELARLKWLVRHGMDVFAGSICTGVYRDSNVLLLAAFGVPSSGIAAYSLAEKLVKAVQASIRPLNQFYFPRVIHAAKQAVVPSRTIFWTILKSIWPQELVVAILIAGLVLAYAVVGPYFDLMDRIDNIDRVFELTLIMSTATFFGLASFMFGSAGLNALGARRYFFITIAVTGIASVLINSLLIPVVGELGAAISFVASEALLVGMVVRRYWT